MRRTFVVVVAACFALFAGTAAATTHWTPGLAGSSSANAHGKGFDPPTSPSAGSATSNSLTVSWTAPGSGAAPTSYAVYRSTSSGGPYTELTSGEGGCAAPATSPCTDNYQLTGSTPYYYEVYDLLGNHWTTATSSFSGTTNGIALVGSCGVTVSGNTDTASSGCSAGAFDGLAASAKTLTLDAPSNITTGDMLIAQVTARVDAAPTSVPTGWTVISGASDFGAGANKTLFQYVYWHLVTSSDNSSSTWTWGWANDADASGGILQFSGVSQTAPVDPGSAATGYADGAPSSGWTTATAPAVTTTVADDEIVSLFASGGAQNFGSASISGQSDTAKQYYSAESSDSSGPSSGKDVGEDDSDAAAGATTSVQQSTTSTGTFTLSQTAAQDGFAWIASTIALEP